MLLEEEDLERYKSNLLTIFEGMESRKEENRIAIRNERNV